MSFFALGVNHQTASVELREQIAFNAERLSNLLAEQRHHESLKDLVVVSTCNRTEVYAMAEDAESLLKWLADANNIDVKQLIHHVCECGLLIGFDSGLYNLSFTMRKPTLCLAADNHLVLHTQPWVKIIHGDKTVYGVEDGLGCEKTNSITSEQVLSACHDLIS